MPDNADSLAVTMRRFDVGLAAEPASVREARDRLSDLGLPDDLVFDAQLLLSELVSNSIRHSGLGDGQQVRVRAEWTGAKLRVVVSDGERAAGHIIVVGSIRPDPGMESGWGLFLVDRLADRWGTDIGEHISYWFEMEADGAVRRRASPL
ncbi:MAG TPA: ATP-binding protein [Actinomycetota bacterium]|jgi:anti-sigma regulatory factor (Ser/Thr protein kinase)